MNRSIVSLLCGMAFVASCNAALSITPSSGTVMDAQTITFAVSGADSNGVTWSLSPAVGTIVQSPTSAVYTAPGAISQSQTVQVEAIAVSNTSLTAKVLLTLVPVAISLSPMSADIFTGGQIMMTPTVTGSANTAVQWSLSPNLGTIDSSGLYSAPSSLTQDTTVTVTAIAQANTAQSASSAITVHANGIYFTTNSNGLQTVFWNGANYNYLYGEGLLTNVYMQPPGGSVTQYAPACSGTHTSTTVTQNCTAGGDSFTLTVSYDIPSAATVRAQIAFTNNSAKDTVSSAMFSTLGVYMSQFDSTNSIFGLSESNPLSIGSFVNGRFAIWNNTPGPNTGFNQACGWSYVCKNQPQIFNVAPGQTATASFSLRFTTNMTESQFALAPEAYAAYDAAYPYIVHWPDRRPIYAWFMSDHGHQSATNPRGYLNQPQMDVSNV
ncbi:MAG: hypothetical protein ABSB15_24280, partial [Bryobacteraceae bacterium]